MKTLTNASLESNYIKTDARYAGPKDMLQWTYLECAAVLDDAGQVVATLGQLMAVLKVDAWGKLELAEALFSMC